MAFGNYSFTNVNVIFGILELQGFAEGDDVVNVTFDTDQFTDVAGAKGDVTRTQTNDNRATVTIKLLQTSQSYKELMALYNIDRETGANVLPMVVINKETGETLVCNNTWIMKNPDIVRGQNANAVEFTFRTDFATFVIA
jgi:Bacteriophage KPP10, Structural protein ORF10